MYVCIAYSQLLTKDVPNVFTRWGSLLKLSFSTGSNATHEQYINQAVPKIFGSCGH